MTQTLTALPYKQRLQSHLQALAADFRPFHNAHQLLQQHAAMMDQLLRDLWAAMAFEPELVLVAVGGYGRGLLFPHSDIDLLVLVPEQLTACCSGKLEQFIGLLWDIGLEVGHSVRSVQSCVDEADKDISVQTTLIEARYLCGDATAFQTLSATIHAHLDRAKFFDDKVLEQKQRHERYQGTAYKLEPNVKESPGGLRDLHTLQWLSRASGLGENWQAMQARGILTASEARMLTRSETLLNNLRMALHFRTKRREDRLLFEHQPALAQQFHIHDRPPKRGSERLMRSYYRAARRVLQLTDILVQNIRLEIYSSLVQEFEEIDDQFAIRNHLLVLQRPEVFLEDSSAILRAFLLLQLHPSVQGFSARTWRALWHARRSITADYLRHPINCSQFLQILREPRGVTQVLRLLHQSGILGRLIPAFGIIVGQMQHDLFHIYTVDEHTLMVVRNLRRFARPEFTHEYPLCSRLIMEFHQPELLYLAGLFHDIAKGRGGDHSELGKVDAEQFCLQLGLPAADAELVSWLVQEHLQMSATAQKQDIYDPEVVGRFAQRVGSARRLTGLYLLTVADIRGTSPKVWNGWKAKLLEDLYHATQRYLAGEDFQPNAYIACRQQEARALLNLYALPEGAEEQLWQALDTSYFLRHKKREIAWHTRQLYNKVHTPEPVVRARLYDQGTEGVQVLVYVKDEPMLFARICSFFERNQYSILDAKIYTTRHGYALDSFYVFLPESGGAHYRERINFIEYELKLALQDPGPIPSPLRGRISRHLKHFPLEPEISLQLDDRQRYHALSIIAGDYPGLLSRVARILSQHQLALHGAKISTLGERAEDTFLISGQALEDDKQRFALHSELMEALRQP